MHAVRRLLLRCCQTHATMAIRRTLGRRIAARRIHMDRRITTSSQLLNTAVIPELDVFDAAIFDALPILGTPAILPQPPAILVVDDELHVGQIVRRLLQETLPQHDIIVATHPASALDHLRTRAVAL